MGKRPLRQWESEFNALCSIPEKNRAHIDTLPGYFMVVRCNAVTKFKEDRLLNDSAKEFTGYEDSLFETGEPTI